MTTKEACKLVEIAGELVIKPEFKKLRDRVKELESDNRKLRIDNEKLLNKLIK